MPFPITIFNTSIDADRFETLEVDATAKTTVQGITGARVVIVSTVDVYVDVGLTPDATTSYALVPARCPLMFGVHNPYDDKVSVRTVSGSGIVTVYHV